MYMYLITNLINNKKYVGQTNNFQRRINEHRSGQGTVIDQAIKAYGVKNFSWEIIWESDNQNEINQKEQEFIIYYNSLVPNGYNIQKGGLNNSMGEQNPNAILTEDEAQWILDNRDKQQELLYNICPFKEKISYTQFKNIYNGLEWGHLKTEVKKANNLSHPGEKSANSRYTDQEVYQIREDYKNGIYYKDAWERSGKKITIESFYNLYNGKGYTNTHMDVYTEENRKKHKPDHSGSNNGRAKVTEEDVKKIRELALTISKPEIYKLYPQLSSTSIRNIIDRKTWKNV